MGLRRVLILAVLLFFIEGIFFAIYSQGKNKPDDQRKIISLEHAWLNNLHDKTALDSILADDFIHPVPQGIFLSKDQHIRWAVGHRGIKGHIQKFDTLFVRVYGNTGIANGIVANFDNRGKLVGRSVFTDIFIKRNGRWQAVNGQENVLQK